ncbi:transmembrane protein 45B-like isoform X2 [Orussus abietinus]|nr:transmembrane protein 45B-like isoform X2 [Orussus abietinus]
MTTSESLWPYFLIGCIFYGFGLKWCYECGKYWSSTKSEEERKSVTLLGFRWHCGRLWRSHPFEGSLKLIATAVGLIGTLMSGLPNDSIVSPKVIHVTIYLFFALSGLVDVLNFYFPYNVDTSLVKLALAQSFFIEGFLFSWTNDVSNPLIIVILSAVVWTTALVIMLELVWSEIKLLRANATLLHGSWIAHMVLLYRIEPIPPEKIALAFSWHIAAASAVTLCIIAVTRSRAPRLTIDEPPEIPMYDYCQSPAHRT